MAGRLYAIILDPSGKFLDLKDLPEKSQRAARIAVNSAAARARTWSARAAKAQVNFPARYLSPSQDRLAVKNKATNQKLEAVVSARMRPTSLARFTSGPKRPGRAGRVQVQVKPGVARYMRNAIFIRLKAGTSDLDTRSNLGLAIRTKGNKRPDRAYKPVQMKNGLWLLYGPSVAQALLSAKNSGIWPDLEPDVQNYLAAEYTRQMGLR